ncbi:hypothetical protein ES708_16597 [subsurface metagenome]
MLSLNEIRFEIIRGLLEAGSEALRRRVKKELES